MLITTEICVFGVREFGLGHLFILYFGGNESEEPIEALKAHVERSHQYR